MKTENVLTTTTSFNIETVHAGDLVALFNEHGDFFGSGIILNVEPMELRIALWTDNARTYMDEINAFEELGSWRIPVQQIIDKEVSMVVLDPKGLK